MLTPLMMVADDSATSKNKYQKFWEAVKADYHEHESQRALGLGGSIHENSNKLVLVKDDGGHHYTQLRMHAYYVPKDLGRLQSDEQVLFESCGIADLTREARRWHPAASCR